MKFIYSLCIALAVLLLQTPPARADVNDFVVNDFSAGYVLDSKAVGGSLETTEKITVTFSDQNHGIFRYVPKSYKGYSTKLKILSVQRDGANEQYETYTENKNLVLKIGSPDQTITGKHIYELKYHQERVVNFDGETPEFYWDVNGNGWDQPFEKVTSTLKVNGYDQKNSKTYCYTGNTGSANQECSIDLKDGTLVFVANRSLLPGEGMTIAASLPAEMFAKPSWKDSLKDNLANIAGLSLGIAGAIFAYRVWNKYGKDYKRSAITVPEYEPPKDLTPAEVGMLADFRVDAKDLSATLIDLAVRKVIRLHETEKKILFVKSKEYSVELLKPDFSGLQKHEQDLLNGIFESPGAGTVVALKDLNRTKMAAAVQESRGAVKKNLADKYGLIESKYPKVFVWMVVSVIAFGILTFIFSSVGFVAGLFIYALSVILAGVFMPRRSHAGVEIYNKIMGLKLYMDVAEKDRLKMMQSVDRPYAAPSKTPKLFEKLLPFAVALGVEKSWAKQFDGILTERPDWISSNSAAAFSGAHLASSISGVAGSFSSSFETSSGSSGGGSSGGGGGGGGGGGW